MLIVSAALLKQIVERQVSIRHHEVDARTAVNKVIILVIGENVIAGTTEEIIHPFAAIEVVIAAHAEKEVIPNITEKPVVAFGGVVKVVFKAVEETVKIALAGLVGAGGNILNPRRVVRVFA